MRMGDCVCSYSPGKGFWDAVVEIILGVFLICIQTAILAVLFGMLVTQGIWCRAMRGLRAWSGLPVEGQPVKRGEG